MKVPGVNFIFILLILQIFIGWQGYRLLVRLYPVYNQRVIRWGHWGMSLIAIGIILVNRWLHFETASNRIFNLLLYAAYIWIIAQILMLFMVLLLYGVKWLTKVKITTDITSKHKGQVTRRKFLQSTAAVVPFLSLGISGQGIYNGVANITTQRLELPFTDLPLNMQGFKIVQISDTHIGPFFDLDKLDSVIAMIKAEKPNLLVITGDLIDDLNLLEQTIAKLSKLHSYISHGIYFCWGNHEYFHDINRVRIALQASPITLLENAGQLILSGERPFYLAGVDYPWAKNTQEQAIIRNKLMDSAMSSIPQNAFTILLAHHPDFIFNSFAANIPLTLSGHTHGGQVAIFGKSLMPLQYHFMRGLYKQGQSYAYVSAGTGHWFPFRLGCPAEITVYTLERII